MNKWSPLEIANALVLLPLLEAPGFVPYHWVGGDKSVVDGQEVTQFPYLIYDSLLDRLFDSVNGADPYAVFPEDPPGVAVAQIFRIEGGIAGATARQIGRYLALCRRGERFGDGVIANEFDEGRIVAALRRLRELLEPHPDGRVP